jgi:hypothetical protein
LDEAAVAADAIGVLRHQRERGEDPDLDRCVDVCAGGDRTKTAGLAASLYQTLQILSVTLSEKTPILCALQTPEADTEFAESVNQLILFDI